VGIGLVVAIVLDHAYMLTESVYVASTLIFGGLALMLFYRIASNKESGIAVSPYGKQYGDLMAENESPRVAVLHFQLLSIRFPVPDLLFPPIKHPLRPAKLDG